MSYLIFSFFIKISELCDKREFEPFVQAESSLNIVIYVMQEILDSSLLIPKISSNIIYTLLLKLTNKYFLQQVISLMYFNTIVIKTSER